MNEYQVFKSGPRKGQPKTLTDRVVRFLVEYYKMKEGKSPSKKYRLFTIQGKPSYRYFVGKAGAVKFGESFGKSVSITNRIMVFMERWEARLQKLVNSINDKLAAGEGAK